MTATTKEINTNQSTNIQKSKTRSSFTLERDQADRANQEDLVQKGRSYSKNYSILNSVYPESPSPFGP